MYSEWDGLSGWMGIRKVRPRICLWSGMQFPVEGSGGKCDPEFAIRVGCSFPTEPQAETASHSGREFWDTVSGCKKGHKTWPSTYICSADTPMTSRAPTTWRLSGRRHIRFIASSARKEGHLMWPSSCAGLFEILRKHPPCRGSRVPAYESDVLSNSLKSFGLPLPRLAFMHWPTKKPITFWLPSRYCCA